jgi:pyruvate formate lyase activating enzyme
MPLIARDWYRITSYRLTPEGRCPDCGTAIAGRFEAFEGQFGRHRIPVAIGRTGGVC